MRRMESEEVYHSSSKVLDVFCLSLFSSITISFLTFRKTLGGPLGVQFFPNPVNGLSRCP